MSQRRCYVKAFTRLSVPLYQLWDRLTDQPVNPLWFYDSREAARARIGAEKATRTGEEGGDDAGR